ncbi:11902_t:CDS:2 [Cetraspora pellucida]|uniref:11893_t:CDS:1 n=2 Tax=Cetraspora pellucida TaxID=1433469 RepID=A0ACA9JWU0_9GLOM|nr:11893_t:CDS:2 [Cetraspora pellucida]CAG8440396.1 11902_t:CDS:2 [Cetraspora pellucida]
MGIEQLSSIIVKNNVERVIVFDNAECSNCEMKEIEEELKKDGIAELEAITNRTPQQEQELQDKKAELAKLEAQNTNENKSTN